MPKGNFYLPPGGGTTFWVDEYAGITSRSRGVPGGLGPPTPRFGGPSYTVWRPHCKFKSKIMNFGALILFFFKKFSSLTLLGMNLIFFSNSFGLTLLIISSSYVYIILCAYFYIILTQAITFLVCKDSSKVFLHTLLHKNINLYM